MQSHLPVVGDSRCSGLLRCVKALTAVVHLVFRAVLSSLRHQVKELEKRLEHPEEMLQDQLDCTVRRISALHRAHTENCLLYAEACSVREAGVGSGDHIRY